MVDTFTAKLNLRKPDPASLYDVLVVNDNNQKIDDAMGAVVCTSTTRPATPWNSQLIYETDTRRFVVRASGAWVPVPGITMIVDAADRATIATLYDGTTIYRKDRDWLEVYDGAAWRVQGTAVCTSTTDRDAIITSPYNGQLAFTTDTNTLWARAGGGWLPSLTIGIGGTQSAMRPTDLSVVNSTAMVNSGLSFTAVANAAYLVECNIPYTAATAGKLQMDWTLPAGASGSWAIFGVQSGDTNRIGEIDTGYLSMATALSVAGDADFAGAAPTCRPAGHVFVSATAGTVHLRMAQAVSNGTATVMKAGAWLKATRMP